MRFFMLVLVALAAAGAAVAQPANRLALGAEARTEMARLAPMSGDWVARVEIMQEDGSWRAAGEERVVIRYLLGDLALREEAAEHTLNGWKLETTIQYDQNRDVFRLVAMDDTWGNMDIYEGRIEDDGRLVLDNLRADTPYVGADGSRLHFRLSVEIAGFDRHVFLVEMSGDAGGSWRPYQRITRQRFGRD